SRAEARALFCSGFGLAMFRGPEKVDAFMQRLLHSQPEPEAMPLIGTALCSVLVLNVQTGRRDMADACLRRSQELVAGAEALDAVTLAWADLTRGTHHFYVERDMWGYLSCAESALQRYQRARLGWLPFGRIAVILACTYLGLYERAEQESRAIPADMPRNGPELLLVRNARAIALLNMGRLDEAAAFTEILQTDAAKNAFVRASSTLLLTEIAWHRGDHAAAEVGLDAVADELDADPFWTMAMGTLRARLRLSQGRPAEALPFCEAALAHSRRLGITSNHRHALLLLIHA
ncbi:MAG: hypothetical protein KC457_34885, partial [Myxococcales bacterium]|nr:hypothetical protein [Myxococcales bacterium]